VWLHHGLSYDVRAADAEAHAPGLPTPPAVARAIALRWIGDRALCPN
jgi:hypothetical protein